MELDLKRTCIIGDTHFGDPIVFGIERSDLYKNVETSDNKILERINYNNIDSVFADDHSDTIIINGDFGDPSFVKKLQFKRKILIMGNHDEIFTQAEWLSAGFDLVVPEVLFVNDFIEITHKPPQYFSANTHKIFIYAHVHETPMYRPFGPHNACVSGPMIGWEPINLELLINKVRDVTYDYYNT